MLFGKAETAAEVAEQTRKSLYSSVEKACKFYRSNPHRFIMDAFHIKLKLFQQIIICAMFRFANCMNIASRGIGKTFLNALFASAYAILYPGSKICIVSRARNQANETLTKIKDVLMPRSPLLQQEIRNVLITFNKAEIEFKNGSKIFVVTANENSRGNRATVLIVDEFRLVPETVIDTVLRKFLTDHRCPGYLDLPEYANYPKERVKEIYASSAWYEAHWSYQKLRSFAANMLQGRSYFCCAMPYQMSIKEGLLDREKIEDEMSEISFDPITFRMEMEALFFAESSSGLFTFNDVDKNRKILRAYYPSYKITKSNDKRLRAPPKLPGEKRILSADVALMTSTKRKKNDATSIMINFMLPSANGSYSYNIVYPENNEGMRTDAQAINIRRLFDEFDCDLLVLDIKGLGIGIYDAMSGDLYDPETGVTYEALSCVNNEDLASRCTVKDARKVIWAISATTELNSQCAIGLRDSFKRGKVRLLINEFDAEDVVASTTGYKDMTAEEQLDLKLPYIHTSLLVHELINLEHENKENVIRVKEKNGERKDRYSSLSYNVYVSKIVERYLLNMNKQKSGSDLVLKIKAPVKKINRL